MKVIKFIKENKAIVFALCIVLLSFGLLALPGQFAHYGLLTANKFKYNFSGYQWMFGLGKDPYTDNQVGKAVPQAIVALSFLVLCVPGLLFSKKSSFVSLLTSIILVATSILFFTISLAGEKAYQDIGPVKLDNYSYILWVPYVIGGLLILAGGLMLFRTIRAMKDEIKNPSQPKGPSYNYLHK